MPITAEGHPYLPGAASGNYPNLPVTALPLCTRFVSRASFIHRDDTCAFVIGSGWSVDGRLVTFAPGRHPNPEVTLTESYETALTVNLGQVNPRNAMLTGKIRPGGDVLKLMSMLPLI